MSWASVSGTRLKPRELEELPSFAKEYASSESSSESYETSEPASESSASLTGSRVALTLGLRGERGAMRFGLNFPNAKESLWLSVSVFGD